jgi:hypothetical protein
MELTHGQQHETHPGPISRFLEGSGRLVVTLAGAVVVGVGVPLLWLWIGSMIQTGRGTTQLEVSTAAAVMVGTIVTYVALLFVAGWAQNRIAGSSGEVRPASRYPWLRSMRDEPYRPGARKLTQLEAIFVTTAVLASVGMLVWFFFFAGSPLPAA